MVVLMIVMTINDNAGADVSSEVFYPIGKTYSSASNEPIPRHDAVDNIDWGASSTFDQSEDAEFSYALIKTEAEENSLSEISLWDILADKVGAQSENGIN